MSFTLIPFIKTLASISTQKMLLLKKYIFQSSIIITITTITWLCKLIHFTAVFFLIIDIMFLYYILISETKNITQSNKNKQLELNSKIKLFLYINIYISILMILYFCILKFTIKFSLLL